MPRIENGQDPGCVYDQEPTRLPMIPVFADGPGSEAFRGIYENTEDLLQVESSDGVIALAVGCSVSRRL
jgi:hypothetical protein